MVALIWARIWHDQARRGGVLGLQVECREQAEILDVGEDRIVSNERNAEPDRRRGYPAVRLMLSLP